MMGVAINIMAAKLVLVFASDSSHCHPADSILDTNILLSHAICPSLCSSNKEDRERDRARVSRLHHHYAGCHAPELIAATKFKTMKINFGGLFGLSTKINTHENYPLYGITWHDFTPLQYLWLAMSNLQGPPVNRKHLSSGKEYTHGKKCAG